MQSRGTGNRRGIAPLLLAALLALGVVLQVTVRMREIASPPLPGPPPGATAILADPPAVLALRGEWDGASPARREQLLEALDGPPAAGAVPFLLAIADREEDLDRRRSILRALERIGGDAAVRGVHRLGRADPRLLDDAALRLSRMRGRDGAAALLSVIDAEREEGPLAASAVRALGRTGLRSAVGILSRLAAGSGDLAVRIEAAEGLGWIADPEAVPVLAALLGDREAKVRRKAIGALGRIRAPGAIAALEGFLANRGDPPPRFEATLAENALATLRGEDPTLRGGR